MRFADAEPELAAGLLQLRADLLADEQLAARLRHKFSIRNTNGYALCALLDADTPLGIFRRLLVGSEGTLAFIAEAVIDTLHAPALTTVAWIVLPSIEEAVELVPALVAAGAEAAELMGAPALTASARHSPARRIIGKRWIQLGVHYWSSSAPTTRRDLMPPRPVSPTSSPRQSLSTRWSSPATGRSSNWTGTSAKPHWASRPASSARHRPGDRRRLHPASQDRRRSPRPAGIARQTRVPPRRAGHAAYGNLHFTLAPKLLPRRIRPLEVFIPTWSSSSSESTTARSRPNTAPESTWPRSSTGNGATK